MINGKKLLALIPARGGSKRLPRKNILDFVGKPLIAWTIEAALNSKYIDRVVVSTDDKEIADISKKYGADVPFMRPVELAEDSASSIDTILHSLNLLSIQEGEYEYLILLQPTSPLRTFEHINEAVDLFIEKKANGVVGVTEVSHPVEWMNIIPKDLSMDNFLSKEIEGMRSQDFEKRYRINGAIYLCKTINIIKEESLFPRINMFAMKMDKFSSVDIDTAEDMNYARFIKDNIS